MFQIIFIKIINTNNTNYDIILEIQKLSSFHKFNIKKIFNNINGAIVEININHLPLLHKNTNIIILYEEDFYNNPEIMYHLQYIKK